MFITVINAVYFMIQFFSISSANFDAGKFLNVTDDGFLGRYNFYHMCLGLNKEMMCCNCKPYCMETKTCCIDALWNSTYTSRQENYVEDFLALSKQYKDPECLPILPQNLFEGYISSYYMVASCQESTSLVSNELKDKCMMGRKAGNSIDYYIPVKGNDDNLYRNKYCAMCNSVSEFEMVQIEKGCNYDLGICQIRLFHLDRNFTLCNYGDEKINKTCSRTNTFYDLCRSFSGPIGKYANYFCHLCNHGYLSGSIKPAICLGPVVGPEEPESWASLLKFDFTDKTDADCKSDSIFDGEKQKCTSYVCPIGYDPKDSKCVAIKVETSSGLDIEEASFDKCLLVSNPNIFIKGTLDSQEVLKELFATHKRNTHNISTQYFGDLFFIDGNSVQNFSINFTAINTKKLNDMLHRNGSITFSQAISHSMINYELTMKQMFAKNMICDNPNPVMLKSINFTQNCDAIIRKKFFPLSNLSLHIIIDKNGLSREAYSCNRFHLSKPCPRKVLSRYHTFKNDTRLYYTKGGATRIYDLHEYAPYKDGSYTVCIDSKNDIYAPPWFSTVNKVSGYLSIVGSSLSVFCYFLLLMTVLQFEELRNIPGLCTLALSINLLIGDGLFLTTNFMGMTEKSKNIPFLCDIIGISIHFFLLSAQMWGLVMAVDTSVNLSKMTLSSQNNNSKFIWYNMIPILFGACLITIALLFRANDIIDVSYSKEGMCVLHGFYSRIFLYFLPLILCFSASVVCLTMSLAKIAKERRSSKNVLKGSTKNNTSMIKVGLKLVILCGLTEGIGIIYIPTKEDTPEGIFIVNSIFMMIYSLFKAFRGVMILIVYLCRQQIYVMYNLRYGKKDIKNKDGTSNGTSTTRI